MSSGSNIETEYLERTSKQEWPILYQQIRSASSANTWTYAESIKPQNKVLNRYRDVSPYDHSRIVLQRGSTDYINANLVKVDKADRRYILTQGPLSSTVGHFWLMIWEQGSKAVLMLNKLVEKKQEKCYQYWPAKIGPEHIMKLDDVGLSLEYIEYQDYSHYLTRTLRITDLESGNSREIIQFHYTTWPDFGVPASPTVFLEFLRKVRAAGALESDVGPAVVHCSAGIGRSGTFCLVDSCLMLIEQNGLNSIDVKEVLMEMRQYRMGLIQTSDQLRFSYQAIIEGAKNLSCQDKENCNTNVTITKHIIEEEEDGHATDEDEPPPLPPPRIDSLNKCNNDGPPIDRPLPRIPISTSLTDFAYEDSDSVEEVQSPPSGPLPVVPAEEEEEEEESSADEVEDELERTDSPISDKSDLPLINSRTADVPTVLSPEAEMRILKRIKRKEQMAAQVRDMKRRQQANEKWTQLKRSLFKPIVITGALVIGGGLFAYFYFKA